MNREIGGYAIISRLLYVFFTETWIYEWTKELEDIRKANLRNTKREKWKAKL